MVCHHSAHGVPSWSPSHYGPHGAPSQPSWCAVVVPVPPQPPWFATTAPMPSRPPLCAMVVPVVQCHPHPLPAVPAVHNPCAGSCAAPPGTSHCVGTPRTPPGLGWGHTWGWDGSHSPPRALGVRGPHGRIVLVLTPQWGSFGGVGGPGTAPLSVPPPIPWELCWQREGQKRTPLANSGRAVTVPGREGHGGVCAVLWGGWVVGLEGGSLRPDAPISLQRVGMPRAAHPTAAPTAEPRSPPRPPPQPPPEPAARMELELLDLSFLTEAERCAIAEVLHRDALLRRTEEGRVRWDPPGPPVGGDRRGVSPGGSRTQWEAAAVPDLGHVPSTSSVSPTRSASPTCAVMSPHPHLCPPVLICHQPFYVPQLVRVPNFICAPSTSAVPPPV